MFTSQNMFVVMLRSDLLDFFQRTTNLAFFLNIGFISVRERKNEAAEDEQSYKKTNSNKKTVNYWHF